MVTLDRQRRHDEKVQREVLDGLARVLDVLHDISDGVRDLKASIDKFRPVEHQVELDDTPLLLTVDGLAKLLGVPKSTVYGLRHSSGGPAVTKVGSKVMFHRADIAEWLARHREEPPESTRPWRGAYLSGRIGSAVPLSAEPTPYCLGSNTEPRAASRYSGRAICARCGDDVLVNKNGTLRKHRPFYRTW